MIHFTCPKCSRKFQAVDAHAGKRTTCAGCGHAFAVPTHDPERTTLHADKPVPTVQATHAPEPRRRGGFPWIALLVVGVLALPVACAGLFVVVWLAARPGVPTAAAVSPVVEGENWTLDEMVAHLNRSGLGAEVHRAVPDEDGDAGVWLVVRETFGEGKEFVTPEGPFDAWMAVPGTHYLVRKKTAEAAARYARKKMHTFGGRSWGRFAISGALDDEFKSRALP